MFPLVFLCIDPVRSRVISRLGNFSVWGSALEFTLSLAIDKRGHQIFCVPLFTFFLPDNPHEKVEVCAKEDGQRSQGQEVREAPEKLNW